MEGAIREREDVRFKAWAAQKGLDPVRWLYDAEWRAWLVSADTTRAAHTREWAPLLKSFAYAHEA